MLVEIVNIEIILTSLDPLDIVYNFVALAIIAEFDDFVCSALRNEPLKLLINEEITEKFLVIKHTTSKKCNETESSKIEIEEESTEEAKVYRTLKTNY